MLSGMTDRHQIQVPPRYARVNAWVISQDTDAELRFLTSVLGAVETSGSRILDADGDIGHVEVELGDSVIMLFDAKPGWSPTPAHLRVYVDDVAATIEEAVAHGARVVTRPTLLAFGERIARVRDPQGHLWWLHERVEDISPDELDRRFADPPPRMPWPMSSAPCERNCRLRTRISARPMKWRRRRDLNPREG
jgi:PhnB protein